MLNDLDLCSQCGNCQAVCPTWLLSGRESDGPRGRIAALRSADAGEIDDLLSRCLQCGRCSRVCPAGIDPAAVFAARRKKTRRALRERTFDFLAARPRLWNALQTPLYRVWAARDYLPPALSRPLAGPVSPRPKPVAPNPEREGALGRVLLLNGCVASRFLAGLVEACVFCLEKAGFAVLMPDNLPCCGQPALKRGDSGAVSALARANVEILASLDFDFLVSPCPDCLAAVRSVWPNALEGEIRDAALTVAARAKDLNSFLLEYLDAPAPAGRAWHRACRLSAEEEKSARALAGASGPVADVCCGAGARDESARRELAARCRDEIRGTASREVASTCPSCLLAIARITKERKDKIVVRHSAEFFAETLGLKTGPGE